MQERGTVPPLSAISSRRSSTWWILLTAGLVILVDQVTKSIAVATLRNGPVHVIGPFSFELQYNTGIAFSLGRGDTALIVPVVIVVVAALILFGRRLESRSAVIAVGLIVGGALSNLSDRLFRGHDGAVVDFIHSTFWPTFNVADACITIGCVLLALSLLRRDATAAPK